MLTGSIVGRHAVLTTILDVLTRTSFDDHRGGALLLTGEHGIGKTACLAKARAAALAAGCSTLETAGTEGETHLPYAGLHRLLAPLLPRAEALPPTQRRALLAALGLQDGAGTDQLAVLVATLSLLREAAARAPLLILVDDVEWLDVETRQALVFVARRMDSRMTAVAFSSTPAALPDFVDAFREVPLRRLDDADARWLVADRGSQLDQGHRDWVVRQAAGNPLALLELISSAAAVDLAPADPVDTGFSLTPRLLRAFTPVGPALVGAARDAALVAAAAMEPNLAEVLAATSLLCGHLIGTEVLEAAQASGVLRVDDVRVHFAHPLVKVAILQQESATRRQAAHRALGAVITLSADRRAWHLAYGATTHDEAIAAELESTVSGRLRRGDVSTAVRALERAAELTTAPGQRGRRLLAAAQHAARLGEPENMQRLVNMAMAGELAPAERMRAELLREDFDGAVIREAGRVVRLCIAADEASAADNVPLALELAEAAARRRCAGPVDEQALERLRSLAVRLASESDDARGVLVLALADPPAHGRAVAARLSGIDRKTAVNADEWSAYAAAARAIGDYGTASELLDLAEPGLRAAGLLGPLGRNLSVAADVRLELGEWDRASSALTEFHGLSAASMSTSHRSSTATTTAKLAALRGDITTALDLVAELEHSPTSRSGSRALARARIVRGIAHLAAGDHADAYDALSRVLDPDDPTHHFREQWDAVAYFAEAAAHVGRQDSARAVLGRLRVIVEVSGSSLLSTHLAYAEAVLAPDALAERLFLAASASGTSGSPWHRARIQLAHGRWLRRQKRVIESRHPLRAAMTLLEELGALRWAAEARDELEAAGESASEPTGGVGHLLSPQEFKIALLAAQGLTNKEIGAQMYLSPRTVSSHLYRIFPKLGITSRGLLSAQLGLTTGIDYAQRTAAPDSLTGSLVERAR